MQKINMLENQLRPMGIPEWVISAIDKSSWDVCVSEGNSHLAYADIGMPIDAHRVTLKPIEMAYAIAKLNPSESDHVLEIGSSVMRLTTVFSRICCGVYTVEHDANRYKADSQIAQKLDLRNVKCIFGNVDGLEEQKYSLIMVNNPMPVVSSKLLSLLLDDGRLCVIEGDSGLQKMVLYNKLDGVYSCSEILETYLPILPYDDFEL